MIAYSVRARPSNRENSVSFSTSYRLTGTRYHGRKHHRHIEKAIKRCQEGKSDILASPRHIYRVTPRAPAFHTERVQNLVSGCVRTYACGRAW